MQPWRKQQWVIPPESNSEFVYHMEDVLEVYTRPFDPKRPLVCLDEQPVPLIGETRLPLPPVPGSPTRYDYEYVRNGVANLFLWYEPLLDYRELAVTAQRTRIDWAHLIQELVDVQHPDAAKIVLVMDQLNTHGPASLYERFPPAEAKRLADKLEIHYTPKHGSWLNMAEIEFSALSRQCLDRRIGDAVTLAREVRAWEDRRNARGGKIEWRFTADKARIKLRHLYPSLAT